MRVGFLFLHPFSGSLGSTVRVRELAISLQKSGVKCYLLTPYEKSQTLCEGTEVICISKFLQNSGLSDYIYRFTKSAYYNGFLARNFLTSDKLKKFTSKISKSVLNVINEQHLDLIQVEQDFAAMAIEFAVSKIKIPVVADLHNITAEELVATKVMQAGCKKFEILQQRTRESLKQLSSVVVVSKEMKDYVVSHYGISSSNIVVVPPGGRPRIDEIIPKSFPPKVVYSGLVSYREHLDLFVRSMAEIEKSHNLQYYVTNKGRWLKEMKRLAKKLNVEPSYFWFPKNSDFHEFISKCDIGVLPSSNDCARQMGTPAKLFEYLSVGLPVVANDVGTWTNLIKEEELGVVTKDNPSDFAAGIMELVQNKDYAIACGRKGLDLVRNKYNWDNSAKILFNEYSRLLNG